MLLLYLITPSAPNGGSPIVGYDVTIANWRGFYGPPDMPEEAVTFWQDAIEELSTSEAWKATAEKKARAPKASLSDLS